MNARRWPSQDARIKTDPDTAVFEAVKADFGDPVDYEEQLSSEDAERFDEQLDDYAEAHAEAETGLQDLSAG